MQQDYVACNSQIFSPKRRLLPRYQLKHLHTYIYKKKACSSYDVIRILFPLHSKQHNMFGLELQCYRIADNLNTTVTHPRFDALDCEM